MIDKIEAQHQGARVRVRLKPGTLRVDDGDTTIEVRDLSANVHPGSESDPYVTGSGLRVLNSGHLGTQERRIYSMGWNRVPEEVREAIMAAAREVLSNHEI